MSTGSVTALPVVTMPLLEMEDAAAWRVMDAALGRIRGETVSLSGGKLQVDFEVVDDSAYTSAVNLASFDLTPTFNMQRTHTFPRLLGQPTQLTFDAQLVSGPASASHMLVVHFEDEDGQAFSQAFDLSNNALQSLTVDFSSFGIAAYPLHFIKFSWQSDDTATGVYQLQIGDVNYQTETMGMLAAEQVQLSAQYQPLGLVGSSPNIVALLDNFGGAESGTLAADIYQNGGRPTVRPDIALGKPSSASSTENYVWDPLNEVVNALKVNDGDNGRSGFWVSNISNSSDIWWQIDLETARPIDLIRLLPREYPEQPAGRTGGYFQLQTSADGLTGWTAVSDWQQQIKYDWQNIILDPPVTARYWRIAFQKDAAATVERFSLAQFEAYATDSQPVPMPPPALTTNVASSGTASASSLGAFHTAAEGNDNNTSFGNYWHSVANQTGDIWWQVDLGASVTPRRVSKAEIWLTESFDPDNATGTYRVEGSNDGVNWEGVTTTAVLVPYRSDEYAFCPQDYRYWRVLFERTSVSGAFALTELKLFEAEAGNDGLYCDGSYVWEQTPAWAGEQILQYQEAVAVPANNRARVDIPIASLAPGSYVARFEFAPDNQALAKQIFDFQFSTFFPVDHSATPASLEDSFFGTNLQFAGGDHWLNRSIGLGWGRSYISWCDVERAVNLNGNRKCNGERDTSVSQTPSAQTPTIDWKRWPYYPDLFADIAASGLNNLPTISTNGLTPDPYVGTDVTVTDGAGTRHLAPSFPTDLGTLPTSSTRFYQFMNNMATQFPDLDYWEMWNEPDLAYPNNTGAWIRVHGKLADESDRQNSYMELLRQGYEGVKVANAGAMVSMGGLASIDVTVLQAMADYTYADGEKGEDYFDIVNIHTYCGNTPPETCSENSNSGGSGSNQALPDLLASVVAWASTKPVWLTEIGYDTLYSDFSGHPAVDDWQQNGNYIARTYLVAQASGVDKLFVFRSEDIAREPFYFGGMGFVTANEDGSMPKHGMMMLNSLIHHLEGTTFVERVDMGDDNVWLLRYSHAGYDLYAGWLANDGTAAVQVGLENGRFGAESEPLLFGFPQVHSINSQSIMVELTGMPTIIRAYSNPPTPPNLMGSNNGSNAVLNWSGAAGGCSFQLYRHDSPYLPLSSWGWRTYQASVLTDGTLDLGREAYYRIQAVACPNRPTAVSDEVGVFPFAVVPGS
ncbi:MAG: discoidin domain-containing protein [Chloroflexota bacterium]